LFYLQKILIEISIKARPKKVVLKKVVNKISFW